ncbi:MAG: SRPBCC family protein [Pseudobdellovibrionaceae bacterium]|nr:SRPBCC family protein [Pseudobdellovibrionaceae bacterium]
MEHRFSLQHEVPQPLEVVQGMLTDMVAFGDLHPLMDHVENLGQGRYRLHEFKHLPFGLKLHFNYEAVTYVDTDNGSILYEAWPKGMQIAICFTLTGEPEKTLVQEDIRIRGLPGFIGILKKAMVESHSTLFASFKL